MNNNTSTQTPQTSQRFQYPEKLSLAQTPTPLQHLKRLSADVAEQIRLNNPSSKNLMLPRIWIKRDDLTGSVLSGNKIRKLEFVIAQALKEGCDTLITCGGEQSNHCRATALIGAQLGLDVCLLLRNENLPKNTKDVEASGDKINNLKMPNGESDDENGSNAIDGNSIDGNLLLDYLAGAEIIRYPKLIFQKQLRSLFEEHKQRLLKKGKKPFVIPTGASDEIGVWGYVSAAEELKQDFIRHNISPKAIVVASGSGGTQAGLTMGASLYDLDAPVVGMAVCDSEQYFIDKVTSDLRLWNRRYASLLQDAAIDLNQLPIYVNDQYIGPGYGKATSEIFQTIKQVATADGIVLDPVYTGKAFHGMLDMLVKGEWQTLFNDFAEKNKTQHDETEFFDIVFVHTGGVFGLFPQKDNFIYHT